MPSRTARASAAVKCVGDTALVLAIQHSIAYGLKQVRRTDADCGIEVRDGASDLKHAMKSATRQTEPGHSLLQQSLFGGRQFAELANICGRQLGIGFSGTRDLNRARCIDTVESSPGVGGAISDSLGRGTLI